MPNLMMDIDWLMKHETEPHWFGLGFIQLKLSETERLHFYPELPGYKSFVGSEEIHDHRYSFTSRVLKGSAINTTYDYTVAPNDGLMDMSAVSCDPTNPVDIEPIRVNVHQTGKMYLNAGSSYEISKGEFHIFEGIGAITHLKRSTDEMASLARVIRPKDTELICPFSEPKPVTELWEVIREMIKPEYVPGYHLKDIKKGVLGEASKILEETQEFIDAVEQDVSIMALVELSDLYGAMKLYLEKYHPSMKMEDLDKFSFVTERAFRTGKRK